MPLDCCNRIAQVQPVEEEQFVLRVGYIALCPSKYNP